MKILQALVSFGVFFLIIGIISIFAVREFLVIQAMEKIKSEFAAVKQKVQDGEFVGRCTSQGNFNTPGQVQIRFQDKQNYTLEVICGDIQSNPIIASKQKLPLLVEKTFGDSGITDLSNQTSEIALAVLGRKAVIRQGQNGNLEWSYGDISDQHNISGPPAACAGFGLTCCSIAEQQGYGKGIQGAVDCPKSCYEGCWERPLILAFNTLPYFELDTRTITIKSGEEIEFNYVISESRKDVFADSNIKDQKDTMSVILALVNQWFSKKTPVQTGLQSVTIDYGDGDKALDTLSKSSFSHKYSCKKESCKYLVNLSATNQQGAEAQATNINSVSVIVTP